MEKVDLFKQFKGQYMQAKEPVLVDIGPAQYLAVEGRGEPGGEVFTEAVGALYSAAFTIKMTRKAAGLGDYVVCKLEAQWWSDQGDDFAEAPMEQWRWRMMIRTPDCVGADDLAKAKEAVAAKGKADIGCVELVEMCEGRCVQMLHVGPYDKEGQTVERMKQFAGQQGLQIAGKHHEIYLSDPRRVPADRLKTILRVPVK